MKIQMEAYIIVQCATNIFYADKILAILHSSNEGTLFVR